MNIALNKQKFKFKCTEMPYIGHLLTIQGLKPDPANVEAILQMPRPTDLAGVQQLIGFVNYLAKFLKELSDLCEPIRCLTSKDVDWQWTDTQEEAFAKIKKAVTQTPVLRYFNSEDETTLQCDASETGLGATLMQKGQPVAFASRALTPTERNYAHIEKELLAIVFGMEKFNHFTYGCKVTVKSDNKPLETIHKKPKASASKCLQGMLLCLQRYEFNIVYKQGKDMYIADALSRAFIAGSPSNLSRQLECVNIVDYLPISSARLREIQDATASDKTLIIIIIIMCHL